MAAANRRRILLTLSAIVVIGLAGGWAGYRLLKWNHARLIEKRIDQYAALIAKHAGANDLPPGLIRSVIRAESGGRARAVSPRQAIGLMQVTTQAEEDIRALSARWNRPGARAGGDLFDPDYNIQVGSAYLRRLADRFGGDAYLAVAAYNMGPTRLDRLAQAHPNLASRDLIERFAPAETRNYCRAVLGDPSGFVLLPRRRDR